MSFQRIFFPHLAANKFISYHMPPYPPPQGINKNHFPWLMSAHPPMATDPTPTYDFREI